MILYKALLKEFLTTSFFFQPCMKAQDSQMESILCAESGRETDTVKEREGKEKRAERKEKKRNLWITYYSSPQTLDSTQLRPQTPWNKHRLSPLHSVRILNPYNQEIT